MADVYGIGLEICSCGSRGASGYSATAATKRSVFPWKLELPGDEAIMHRDGDRLVIEPVRKRGLVALLEAMKPLEEGFPEIDDPVSASENVLELATCWHEHHFRPDQKRKGQQAVAL